MRLLVLTFAIVVALPGLARGHQSSVKYASVAIEGAGAQVTLTISPSDVTEPLGLADDARPTLAEALAGARGVAAYVAGWLALAEPTGAPCVAGAPRAGPDPDHKLVVVRWEVTCPAPIVALALDFTRFFAVDPRHEAILAVAVARAGPSRPSSCARRRRSWWCGRGPGVGARRGSATAWITSTAASITSASCSRCCSSS